MSARNLLSTNNHWRPLRRVLVIRLDLHVEKYTPDNRELSRFIDKIKIRLAKHYKTKRLGYLWVREQERLWQDHGQAIVSG